VQEKQLTDWIALINSDNIGPVTFYKMLGKYGSAGNALDELAKRQKVMSRQEAAYEIENAVRSGIKILAKGDPEYPISLAELNDAPPVLYVKGRTDILNYPAAVAVVGSRSASINGRKIASKIAYDLTESDVLIVSGMARGIDAAAHKGALYAKNQQGTTIAVLGTGVDIPYPSENAGLYEQICKQGAVISEFKLGTAPQTTNFPRRNRLVAALSAGTLVVEASLNSGSLITARMALEQGRDVFAVPGSPLDGRSAGANRLIRDGAVLTESAADILEMLRFTQNRQIKTYSADLFTKPLDKEEKSVDIPHKKDTPRPSDLTAMIPENGIETDELIRLAGQPAAQIMTRITELELDGIVERINGSLLILKSSKRNRKKQ